MWSGSKDSNHNLGQPDPMQGMQIRGSDKYGKNSEFCLVDLCVVY